MSDTTTLSDVFIFRNIFGRGLVGELKDILATPALIVTMKDIWALPMIRKNFPDDAEKRGFNLHFVESLERKDLLNAVPELKSKGISSVVGLGGGQVHHAQFHAHNTMPNTSCPIPWSGY